MIKQDIREITKLRLFDNLSYARIGSKLGVTKQYLSFLCNKRKNQPEVINQELAVEFEKNKRGYELPDQLRIKRKLLGLTQAHVAKQVGTFAPVVTRIEKGKLKNSIFIQRIADYLDI